MKLLTFRHQGVESWGVLKKGSEIVDIPKLNPEWPTLRSALEAGAMAQLPQVIQRAGASHTLASVELLPVVPNPPKIICIGVNYHDHRVETGRDVSARPMIFARYTNTQIGHGQSLVRPPESSQFDYEGEIALVIGKRGRRIPPERCWEYIAGYSAYCDATIRDWQRHTQQWTPGKNFPGTGGFGPWMVTRDEVADGADLMLSTRLNGTEVQRSSTSLMIFDIPTLIAYCSGFTELEPGDVIATGTPGGIGAKRNPPLWLKPGDVLEIEVSQVGTLRHTVRDEGAT